MNTFNAHLAALLGIKVEQVEKLPPHIVLWRVTVMCFLILVSPLQLFIPALWDLGYKHGLWGKKPITLKELAEACRIAAEMMMVLPCELIVVWLAIECYGA